MTVPLTPKLSSPTEPPAGAAIVHLTISGDLGSGKSAVAAALAEQLGYQVVSTGAIQRSIAAAMHLTTLQANLLAEQDQTIDDQIDSGTQQLAAQATQPIIFDSRMAWHFVPHCFRVRLTVDPATAAKRVLDRDPAQTEAYQTLDQAAQALVDRAASERRRFTTRYGVDITKATNFDLVIDTTRQSVQQVAEQIVCGYNNFSARRTDEQR
ncbi:MAG: cytidylate kinase family protein [Bifidobacteriaceae bacterium]|nr:cytidylate kinase family protein [Bifidobacteriaceae bacterium]